jgi:predicted patatin/cPLA2 family phospholipase
VRGRTRARAPLAAAALALAAGCATVPDRTDPLPEALSERATVPGIPGARYWGDLRAPALGDWVHVPPDALRARYGGIMDREHHYLVLSGGGEDGAYGAGVLVGWSEAGTRPEFTVVTGVSTGALIAPFAFLGRDYDRPLQELYTAYGGRDLIEPRGLLEFLRNDAAASTRPLRRLIERHVDDAMVEAIAREHRRGRGLLISTTHLDAGRPMTWNVGAIAASGAPGARALIHDVMLASASIPVAFPPVPIAVEADGRRFTELHVDGGVTAQLFLYPSSVDWRRVAQRLGVRGTPTLYVIRNAKLAPQWHTVPRRVPQIAGVTISTLIRTQGVGDLAQTYLNAQRDGIDFRLTYIPTEFDAVARRPFDPEYMRRLFAIGRDAGRDGTAWMRPAPAR